jgi:hypothetical protein
MQLNEEQKKAVSVWCKEGCGLSEIQRRLSDQFKLALTYIDVRFLLIDLGLDVKDPKAAAPVPKVLKAAPPPIPGGAHDEDDAVPELMPDEGGAAPGGGLAVEVDRVTRSGAMVSGTVVFSDGVKANWAIDQMGRLALMAGNKNYRPSADDIQAFQQTVMRELQKRGY